MQIKELQEKIIDELKKIQGEYGLYVKFLSDKNTIQINVQQQFWAASVIKILVMVEFFKQVDAKVINMENRTLLKPENIVDGSGVIKSLNEKNTYTWLDLVWLMIIVSDNSATNEIIDLLGWENINRLAESLELNRTTFKHKMQIKAGRGPNLTTAEDITKLLELIYANKLPYSDKMLEILNETKLRSRMPRYLPNEIRISHKTGSLPQAVHDVGVVYAIQPFILSFLSDDVENKDVAEDVIGRCTQFCYEYVQKNTKKTI